MTIPKGGSDSPPRTHFATDVLSPSNLGGLFSAGAIHKTNGTALPFRAIPLDSHRVERMFSARFCGMGEIISATLNRRSPFRYVLAPVGMKRAKSPTINRMILVKIKEIISSHVPRTYDIPKVLNNLDEAVDSRNET